MQLFHFPQIALPEVSRPASRRLQVFVLFNGNNSTAAALRTGGQFVAGLGGEIIIAAIQIVPYPLSLDHPPVDRGVLIQQIEQCIAQAGLRGETAPRVLIVYARNFDEGRRFVLPRHCIVVVGSAKSAFLQRLRSWITGRRLRKWGHEVLLSY